MSSLAPSVLVAATVLFGCHFAAGQNITDATAADPDSSGDNSVFHVNSFFATSTGVAIALFGIGLSATLILLLAVMICLNRRTRMYGIHRRASAVNLQTIVEIGKPLELEIPKLAGPGAGAGIPTLTSPAPLYHFTPQEAKVNCVLSTPPMLTAVQPHEPHSPNGLPTPTADSNLSLARIGGAAGDDSDSKREMEDDAKMDQRRLQLLGPRNSPLLPEEEAFFQKFTPLSQNLNRLSDFFAAVHKYPRNRSYYIIQQYVYLSLSNEGLLDALLQQWDALIFPLMCRKPRNDDAMLDPRHETELQSMCVVILTQCHYHRFANGNRKSGGLTFHECLHRLLSGLESFAEPVSAAAVIRIILTSLIKWIQSQICKGGGQWRMSDDQPASTWQSFWALCLVVKEFVLCRPGGIRLCAKGCEDSTLILAMVSLLGTLRFDQQMSAAIREKGVKEQTLFTTLLAYVRGLSHLNTKLGSRLHDTTLKPALIKVLTNKNGWTTQTAASLLEENEKDVIRYQNAELLTTARMNGEGRMSQFRAQIPDEINSQTVDLIMKQIAAGAPLVGRGRYGRVFGIELWSIKWAVKLFAVPKSEEKRIFDEIHIHRSLRGRRSVLFRGACTKPPHYLVVTEYMAGGNLDTRIRQTYDAKQSSLGASLGDLDEPLLPLTEAEKFKIATQIVEGLIELHALDIVHRDLKPSNILLDDYLNVKLCDFGYSHLEEPPAAPNSPTAFQSGKNLTAVKQTAGTDLYKSPETWGTGDSASPIGTAADIYSTGNVFHELWTGAVPWASKTREQLKQAHSSKLTPAVDFKLQHSNRKLSALIYRMLQSTPKLRPSAVEVLQILKTLTAEFVMNRDVAAPTATPSQPLTLPRAKPFTPASVDFIPQAPPLPQHAVSLPPLRLPPLLLLSPSAMPPPPLLTAPPPPPPAPATAYRPSASVISYHPSNIQSQLMISNDSQPPTSPTAHDTRREATPGSPSVTVVELRQS